MIKECHWTTVVLWDYSVTLFVASPLALLVYYLVDADSFSESWSDTLCVLESASACTDVSFVVRTFALGLWMLSVFVQYAGKTAQVFGYQVAKHTQRANIAVYLEIPYAYLLQVVMYGETIDTLTTIGIVIIVVASAVGFTFARSRS